MLYLETERLIESAVLPKKGSKYKCGYKGCEQDAGPELVQIQGEDYFPCLTCLVSIAGSKGT